jgi:aldehyde:ferredoxin oxidoreductase
MPEMVYWQVRAKEINDALGICCYMTNYFGVYALSNRALIELANPLLGRELSEEEYMEIGRRANNLEKAFTTMQTDFDRKDDLPPKRQMEEPIADGPYKGEVSSKKDWNAMLDKFYKLQDWDIATGLQTRSGLENIGLKEVADKLAKVGKLIEK